MLSSSSPSTSDSASAAMPALQKTPLDPPASYVLQLAADGHVLALRMLFEHSPALARVSNDIARTALHVAAAEGHAHVVRLLLQTGADAGACDAYGRTAAEEATRAGHIRVLRVLALFDAPCAPLESRLYADVASARALFAAAASGDVRSATVAVAAFRAHVNVTNVDGRTPLHLAVACGHAAVASYLIAAGADATIKDRRGVTPAAAANIATDPAIRALFEGVRASAAAKISTMQAASAAAKISTMQAAAAAAEPPRRRGASLPRITRVAAQKAAAASQDSQPRFEIRTVPVHAVQNSRKRHSAPLIVKVLQENQDYPAEPSPRHDPLRQQEQARLLKSAFTAAEQQKRASLVESEAIHAAMLSSPHRIAQEKKMHTLVKAMPQGQSAAALDVHQQQVDQARLFEAQQHAKQYLQQEQPMAQSHPMAQAHPMTQAHPMVHPVGHSRASSAPTSSPALTPVTLMTGTAIN